MGHQPAARARAGSRRLAHNWPYAGDPLFTDIILSERGVDDAWQSTAIGVGPDAASVAMAHTGERFVVGYPAHDRVRVWAQNASGWYEFFSTDHYFDAGANDPQVSPGDGYGTTVAMSGNGEVIVVGAPATKRVYTYQAYLYDAEYAKQHSYPDGGHWWENHQTHTEPDYGCVSVDVDGFGTALSLSGSGRTLAISAPGADGHGHVYVYRWTDSGTHYENSATNPYRPFRHWQAYGDRSNLVGSANDDFGRRLALDEDGDTLAVGTAGALRVFKYNATHWDDGTGMGVWVDQGAFAPPAQPPTQPLEHWESWNVDMDTKEVTSNLGTTLSLTFYRAPD